MQLLIYVIYLLFYFASVTVIMLILPGRKLDVLCNGSWINMHLSTSASPIDQSELEIIGMLDGVKNRIWFIPGDWTYVCQVDRNATLHDLWCCSLDDVSVLVSGPAAISGLRGQILADVYCQWEEQSLRMLNVCQDTVGYGSWFRQLHPPVSSCESMQLSHMCLRVCVCVCVCVCALV